MSDFKKQALSGFTWVGVFTILNSTINPIVIIILSYFLSVEDFGLRSIVTIIIGLGSAITQFGIAQAIIQKDQVSNRELNTLFWISTGLGIALFVIVYLSAGPIATFYNDSSLRNLIKTAGLVLLVAPIGTIFGAILEKKLLFKNLTILNIIRLLVTSIGTVLLAFIGYGVYSIIFGQLLGHLTFLILIVVYFITRNIWFPEFKFNLKDSLPYYKFGVYVTGKNILNYIGKNADELIIGRVLGVESLGIYHFAKQIIQKLIDVIGMTITKVCYPLFSKLKNNKNTNMFKRFYLKTTIIVSLLGTPIFGVVIICMPFVIDTFFDNKWADSVIIMQILAVKGTIDIISAGFASSALYAYNKPKLVFNVDLFLTPIRIFAIYLASFHSLTLVAVVFLIIVFIKFYLLQTRVNKLINISWIEYSKGIIDNYIVVGLMVIIGITIESLYDSYITFYIALLLYIITYLAYLFIFKKSYIKDIVNVIKG